MSSKPIQQKTQFNLNDNRFGLVKWVGEKEKYSVIPMTDVEVLPPGENDYILNNNYRALFGEETKKRKYMATLKFIGSEQECDSKLESILNYSTNNSLSARVNKAATAKTANQLNNSNRIECQLSLLESENKDLKSLLEEKDSKLSKLEKLIKEKDEKIQTLENQSRSHGDIVTKERLMNIATCIFNAYGTKDDLENLSLTANGTRLALLSPEHEFTIPLDLKLELERISKKSTTTTTGFFRDVLKSQLNDLNILAQSNAFVLLDKYPIVNACKIFVRGLRQDFTDDLCIRVCREVCCEARQKIWETSPNREFNVNGKILRRSENKSNSTSRKPKRLCMSNEEAKSKTKKISENNNTPRATCLDSNIASTSSPSAATLFTSSSSTASTSALALESASAAKDNGSSASPSSSSQLVLQNLTNIPAASSTNLMPKEFINYLKNSSNCTTLSETNDVISSAFITLDDLVDDDTCQFFG